MKWLGWLALVLCGVMLFVWIPLDVDTGIIEKVRRQVTLGDSFAPTVAALIIGLGGILILLETRQIPSKSPVPPALSDDETDQVGGLSNGSLRPLCLDDGRHAIVVLILIAISLLLMRYVGPLLLQLVEGGSVEYRLLRDTVPWKYLGFISGGVWLIVSLIAFNEKRIRWQHFLVALAAVLVLIAFYDLPFDDLLLPPNGDV